MAGIKGKSGIKPVHGLSRSRFYHIWASMKARCANSNNKVYGGKGIRVCTKWLTFTHFLNDMYPSYLQHVEQYGESNTSVERIDNEKGYSKNNCRWATRKEQVLNRAVTHLISFNGHRYTLTDWASVLKIKRSTLAQRYYVYNWSVQDTLTTK